MMKLIAYALIALSIFVLRGHCDGSWNVIVSLLLMIGAGVCVGIYGEREARTYKKKHPDKYPDA